MLYDLWPQNKFRSQWHIFHGPVISLLLFFALKIFLVLLAKPDSGELRCPVSALIWSKIGFLWICEKDIVNKSTKQFGNRCEWPTQDENVCLLWSLFAIPNSAGSINQSAWKFPTFCKLFEKKSSFLKIMYARTSRCLMVERQPQFQCTRIRH